MFVGCVERKRRNSSQLWMLKPHRNSSIRFIPQRKGRVVWGSEADTKEESQAELDVLVWLWEAGRCSLASVNLGANHCPTVHLSAEV